ncbi:MAG TPA: hypothetical protein VLC55_06475 [Burkholderiales bacterium]|nr:hypothetical protein [Burkholderiales bacterium]
MTLSGNDLKRLRGALLLLVVVASAGAAAVYASLNYVQAQRAATRAAEQQAADARKRVMFVRHEKEDLLRYYPKYQSLMERGVVGSDRRLDWVEAVEALGKRHGLFSLKYTMGAQKPLDAPAAAPARAGFDVSVSPMTLEVTALHEGQLLDFLDSLRQEIKGLGMLERCALARTGSGRELRFAPQISATCTVGWVTLRERKAS